MTDADLSRPLASLVDDVQRGAKQAQFLVTMGKKEDALDSYLRTSTLAIKLIPLHRDYHSLKSDRKQLGQKYNHLVKELSDDYETYEAIKKHKMMKQQQAGETKAADDLKSRMAKLRNGPAPVRIQDPRIRTQPPIVSPSGRTSKDGISAEPEAATHLSTDAQSPTRKKPPPPPPKPPRLTTNGGVIMPKLPDAIYSPARGGNTSHHQDLPSSTPRGSFSRGTSFFPVVRSTPKPALPNGSSVPHVHVHIALPEGDIITVEDLLKYQRNEQCRVLLIDVRPRADFEDGHILSSSTICIEPDIIDRPGIEAQDVEDSMVLGTAEEKDHFERRHDYDMVVIYDQSSEDFGDRKNNASKLFTILSDFDYPEGDPASKHPKLLKGGVDAWKDSMGSHALRNSGHKRRRSTYDKPWLRSPTKPIQNPEEAKRWEQHLTKPEDDEDEANDADEVSFAAARSINDFLTRFPSVQESMTSPVEMTVDRNDLRLPAKSMRSPTSPQKSPELPMPPREPTRPPPAVPRRSYSGLQPPDDDEGTASKAVTRRNASSRGRAVGLINPGNWCYANSTLQALFASGDFGEELYTNAWQHLYKPPKKADEKIMPPQLLTKIMANLFLWMGTAKFDMKADTLMQYLRHITSKGFKGPLPLDQVLGGHRQMDAHELLLRLFLELHDETNRHRDRPDVSLPPPPANKSILEGAVDIWNLYRKANDSIIDKYWQTLECLITRCETCGHVTYRVDPPKNHIVLSLPETQDPQSIESLLNNYFAEEHLEDYKCDGCGLKGGCKRMPRFARLPDLLCVFFGRFENKLRKNNVYIDFPHHDLDLTPYSIQGQSESSSSSSTPKHIRSPTTPAAADHHFTKPFRYDAYAVIQHGGQLVGGHYVAVVREGPEGPDGKSMWRVADDSKLTTQWVGPGRNDPGTKFLFRQGRHWATPMDAYMVFYQRKDVGLSN